jgi:FdhD protein
MRMDDDIIDPGVFPIDDLSRGVTRGSVIETTVEKIIGLTSREIQDSVAVEEPLEIQLGYGPADSRQTKSISVTMRTPGNDFELAAGFLMREGVVRDANDIEQIAYASGQNTEKSSVATLRSMENAVRVELATNVTVSIANLQRNFYTTSSCGICGKASLLALQTVCPPRAENSFKIDANVLYSLPGYLREAQEVFDRTGGLHGVGLFDSSGHLFAVREDVGRHNAVDKLLGSEFLADRTPLRNSLLLLSGRASFELLQKAIMGGVPMVASVGAPSSLAVQVARKFDIILIGFLREDHFNIYHGREHIHGYTATSTGADE